MPSSPHENDLDKEIDDVVAPIPEPKTNWLLIGFVALATTIIVFVIAWGSGSVVVQPRSDAIATNANLDMKIKGNIKTMIYHKQNCMNYNILKEENTEWFKNEDAAVAAGYRPAKNCG